MFNKIFLLFNLRYSNYFDILILYLTYICAYVQTATHQVTHWCNLFRCTGRVFENVLSGELLTVDHEIKIQIGFQLKLNLQILCTVSSG